MRAFDVLDTIIPLQIWEGVSARVWSGEKAALAAIELAPNSHVPEHSHENEQTGILLRGELTFRVGAETQHLAPGATWVVPSGVPHEVRVGPDGALLVELFAPPRSDWADLARIDPSPV